MKALLYSFSACLYAMQLCVIACALFFFNDIPFGFVWIIFGALFGLAAFALGCVNIAFGIAQMSNPKKPMGKTVMIVKLTLIPFFVMNFIIGFCMVAAFANPFLFLAGFILIPVMVVLTYAAMLVASSYNVGILIHKIRIKDKSSATGLLIASQFFYVLDVVGAIFIYVLQRKEGKAQTDCAEVQTEYKLN